MVYKTTLKSFFSFLVFYLFFVGLGFGQSIFDNPITETVIDPDISNPYTNGQYVDPNITVSGIGKGMGVIGTPSPTNYRYNLRGWSMTFDSTEFFEFTLTPNSGYEIDFVSFEYTSQRSAAGPPNIEIRTSLDGYNSNVGSQTLTMETTPVGDTVDLNSSSYQNIATSITFRIYSWGATDFNGSFSINDFTFNGTVSAIPPCNNTPTTFSAGTWDNGVPDLSTPAIIATNYNTATDGGSFSACSLLVEAGATLTINDEDSGSLTNDYVEVQNDVIINGTITMEPKAAFVQLDDLGTVSGTGTALVAKETAPMNRWYEYTYWSSPVRDAEIGIALADSEPSRRFVFKAENYVDEYAESNNDNTETLGQDGVDDDNNVWQRISGTTVMEAGVGYAATHSEDSFIAPPMSPLPYQFRYTFNGLFNNGIITTPVYRVDIVLDDDAWNLIGNPYPSAIDADLFLAANNAVDGAIYLWSQNTPPSNTNNGNEQLNFSSSDYAIINGTGQLAGGDGTIPERTIPSGQAFFISMPFYSNPGPGPLPSIFIDNVTFNNSMRLRGAADNSQFFKGTYSKNNSIANKLWIDLTSDNGIFNQTLVGYVNDATNADDGNYFDTKKVESSGAFAIIYSLVDDSSSKFAIQGKAANSLSETETIKLGFSTTIDVATLYTLSIAQLQGDFLTANVVYLKDNITGTVHNLKECDYIFTSEVGEFNDRFVVMFNNQSLSIDELVADTNTLKIIDLDNDRVKFTITNDLRIKTVSVFDLLGRELYAFKGQSNSETYHLSNLKNNIYIAKVELSNGAVITKKAVKK